MIAMHLQQKTSSCEINIKQPNKPRKEPQWCYAPIHHKGHPPNKSIIPTNADTASGTTQYVI